MVASAQHTVAIVCQYEVLWLSCHHNLLLAVATL